MATPPELSGIPDALAVRKRRFGLQWVWLLPLVAALVGGWLAVRAVMSVGPTVTIRFKTAEGLEPNKTRLKYKDVEIGVVKSVGLAEDRAGIIVKAALSKSVEDMLVDDTRFWVVRARIAGGTVSAIGTLLSGSYIGMDPGQSAESRRAFEGLETPPIITSGADGKQFVLRGEDVGSLDVGSPAYFRRLEVGRVVAYEVDAEGAGVILRVFVNAPYDRFVTQNTRFWHASGIDVAFNANGLSINTESIASIIVGAIAFQTPPNTPMQAPVAERSTFTLFDDRVQAMRQPITVVERYGLRFRESMRGLAVGSPVEFRGVSVGEVRSIDVDFDRARRDLGMIVEIDFYPERLFSRRASTAAPPVDGTPTLARLVERGLRAQLRAANLLTGQQFIALEFDPGSAGVRFNTSTVPPQIPTLPGTSHELQATVAAIAKRLQDVPFEQIGADLRQTLQGISTLALKLEKEVAPEARAALVEAQGAMIEARKALATVERTVADVQPLPEEASEAVREVGRAAQSLRTLTDYLERHPESLLRGKRADAP